MNFFDPDAIFAELEKAHHALLKAMEANLVAKEIYDLAIKHVYRTLRLEAQEGKKPPSVDDAWVLARLEPAVQQRADEARGALLAYEEAEGRYKHCLILAELRRTQEASLRSMGVRG